MIWSQIPGLPRGQRLKLNPEQRGELERGIADLFEQGYSVVENHQPPDWRSPGRPVTADRFLRSFERESKHTQLYLVKNGQEVSRLDTLAPLTEEAIFALDARPEGSRYGLANQIASLPKSGWDYGQKPPRIVYRRLTDPRGTSPMHIASPGGHKFLVHNLAQFKLLTGMAQPNPAAYLAAATGCPTVVAALSAALDDGKIPLDKSFEAVEAARHVKGIQPEAAALALERMLRNNTPYEESVKAIRTSYSTRGMPEEEALDLRCRLMTAVGPEKFSQALFHAGQVHSDLLGALKRKYPHRGSAGLSYTAPEAVSTRQTFIGLVEQGWALDQIGKLAARAEVFGGVEELRTLGKWLPRDQDLSRQVDRLTSLRPAGLSLEQAALIFQACYRKQDAEVKRELERFAAMSEDERARQLAPVLVGGESALREATPGVVEQRAWVIVGGVRVPRRS